MHISAILLDLYKFHATILAPQGMLAVQQAIDATKTVAEGLDLFAVADAPRAPQSPGIARSAARSAAGAAEKWLIEALLANFAGKSQKQERDRAWGIANVLLISDDSSPKIKQELALARGRKVSTENVEQVCELLRSISPETELHTERFDFLAEQKADAEELASFVAETVPMPKPFDLMLLTELATVGPDQQTITEAEFCADVSEAGFGLLMQKSTKEHREAMQGLVEGFVESADVLTEEGLAEMLVPMLEAKTEKLKEVYEKAKAKVQAERPGPYEKDKAGQQDAAIMFLEKQNATGRDLKEIVNMQNFQSKNLGLSSRKEACRFLRKAFASHLTMDEVREILTEHGYNSWHCMTAGPLALGMTYGKILKLQEMREMPDKLFFENVDLSAEAVQKTAKDLAKCLYAIAVANETKRLKESK